MPSLIPLTNSYNSHYGCLCFYRCSLPSHISSEVGNRQISCLLWLSTASRIEETSKFCATQNLGRQVVGKCSDRVLTVSDSRSKTLSLCHTEILLCRCQMWQHRPFSLEVDLGCELNFFVPWSNSFPWFYARKLWHALFGYPSDIQLLAHFICGNVLTEDSSYFCRSYSVRADSTLLAITFIFARQPSSVHSNLNKVESPSTWPWN